MKSTFIITNPLTRFAPSPTGYLHKGHILNAIYVWGLAKLYDGMVLLRMEDHDRQRSQKKYELEIINDLKWLGFIPDIPDVAEFMNTKCNFRQSDNTELYDKFLETLIDQSIIYACNCSRKLINQNSFTENADELYYPGTCRNKGLPLKKGYNLRLTIPDIIVEFRDIDQTIHSQQPKFQCGDFIIKDRNGNYSYQFAVVVDDIRHGVNLVIRGNDLYNSTGRQIILHNLLHNKNIPLFYHHNLLTDENGRKLSKRFFSQSISEIRGKGLNPSNLIGEICFLSGLSKINKPLAAEETYKLFKRL